MGLIHTWVPTFQNCSSKWLWCLMKKLPRYIQHIMEIPLDHCFLVYSIIRWSFFLIHEEAKIQCSWLLGFFVCNEAVYHMHFCLWWRPQFGIWQSLAFPFLSSSHYKNLWDFGMLKCRGLPFHNIVMQHEGKLSETSVKWASNTISLRRL